MRGLRCSIYESKALGNCSNNGISNRCKNVTLIANEQFPDVPPIFEAADDAPAVVIRELQVGRKTFYHAIPVELINSGKWAMAGGNFISTCDSRFPFDYPLPLHDRVE